MLVTNNGLSMIVLSLSIPRSFSLHNVKYSIGDCVYLPPSSYKFPVKKNPKPTQTVKKENVSTTCCLGYMYIFIGSLIIVVVVVVVVYYRYCLLLFLDN